MRKKSHISLARYIVANTKDEELKKHKLFPFISEVSCRTVNRHSYTNDMKSAEHFHWSRKILNIL